MYTFYILKLELSDTLHARLLNNKKSGTPVIHKHRRIETEPDTRCSWKGWFTYQRLQTTSVSSLLSRIYRTEDESLNECTINCIH